MLYPVVEIFKSLEGEGTNAGMAAVFVRLGGCNLNCQFCDTDFFTCREMSISDIVAKCDDLRAPNIVLTGGEPTIHNLAPLMRAFSRAGYCIYIQTNGTLPLPDEPFKFVVVSPKPNTRLNSYTMWRANELKYLVGLSGWEDWIWEVESRPYAQRIAHKYVMPVAMGTKHSHPDDWCSRENTKLAIDFVKRNPRFRLAVQLHKYLNIR